MIRSGGDSIVNIGSVQAFVSEYGISHYAASKSGIVGLTRAISIDCAPLIGTVLIGQHPLIRCVDLPWRL
jgi:NAD(P)-dependent dehydrogenase (short-subunit alcohol dehydrogenase family)